jgi:hypothetical protein
MTDSRRNAPATERNRDPILAVLRTVLPTSGTVLEVASGTGEHIVHFAAALPALSWQPSDPDAQSRASIDAWVAHARLPNVAAAIDLDAASDNWPAARTDAILCINMVHISPWGSAEGLLAGAEKLLAPGAPLFLYGPFLRSDVPTAPSNLAFDHSLKARDPRWGLRDLDAVVARAASYRLARERVVEMPANNLSVVFRRQG